MFRPMIQSKSAKRHLHQAAIRNDLLDHGRSDLYQRVPANPNLSPDQSVQDYRVILRIKGVPLVHAQNANLFQPVRDDSLAY